MDLDDIFESADVSSPGKRCFATRLSPEHKALLIAICERFHAEGQVASKNGLHRAFVARTKSDVKARSFTNYLTEYKPKEQVGGKKKKPRR